MRKRSRIIFTIVAVACLGGIAWLVLRHSEPEPAYQGKPLSYWLAQYTIAHRNMAGGQQLMDSNLPIDAAVRHMGTNVTPTLLRMLRENDSALKARLMLKLMPFLHRQKLAKFDYFPASLRNSQAAWAFRALDGMDNSAVPELIKIYDERISPSSQNCAILALGTFTNQNELRVPVFIKALQASDSSGRLYALTGLARIGKDAGPAAPAIVQALQDTNSMVRSAASSVLRDIDPEAAAKAGVK